MISNLTFVHFISLLELLSFQVATFPTPFYLTDTYVNALRVSAVPSTYLHGCYLLLAGFSCWHYSFHSSSIVAIRILLVSTEVSPRPALLLSLSCLSPLNLPPPYCCHPCLAGCARGGVRAIAGTENFSLSLLDTLFLTMDFILPITEVPWNKSSVYTFAYESNLFPLWNENEHMWIFKMNTCGFSKWTHVDF